MGLLGVCAQAQSSISMASSSNFVDFYTGSPSGSLDVVLGWTPGDNYTGNHTMDGALNSSTTPGAWGSSVTYSLTSYDPVWLQNNGNGNFSALPRSWGIPPLTSSPVPAAPCSRAYWRR
jgi:hypothetical protein